jgi:hypothetical protein
MLVSQQYLLDPQKKKSISWTKLILPLAPFIPVLVCWVSAYILSRWYSLYAWLMLVPANHNLLALIGGNLLCKERGSSVAHMSQLPIKLRSIASYRRIGCRQLQTPSAWEMRTTTHDQIPTCLRLDRSFRVLHDGDFVWICSCNRVCSSANVCAPEDLRAHGTGCDCRAGDGELHWHFVHQVREIFMPHVQL